MEWNDGLIKQRMCPMRRGAKLGNLPRIVLLAVNAMLRLRIRFRRVNVTFPSSFFMADRGWLPLVIVKPGKQVNAL